MSGIVSASAFEKPVAKDWYQVLPVCDGISLIRERHVADWLRCNIWHVRGRDKDILIDSGMGLRPLKSEVAALAERPVTAISTHCHFDHIGGAHEFDERLGHRDEAHIHAHPDAENAGNQKTFVRAETFSALPYGGFKVEDYAVRAAPLTGFLDEGDLIDLGDRVFQVFHLPGHSPGSIVLFEAHTGTLFAGDVVYNGDLLDTVYHSDPVIYRQSLERLRTMAVTTIHGGHGGSFGFKRMIEIIDLYANGGGRIGDVNRWVEHQIAASQS